MEHTQSPSNTPAERNPFIKPLHVANVILQGSVWFFFEKRHSFCRSWLAWKSLFTLCGKQSQLLSRIEGKGPPLPQMGRSWARNNWQISVVVLKFPKSNRMNCKTRCAYKEKAEFARCNSGPSSAPQLRCVLPSKASMRTELADLWCLCGARPR